MQEKGRKGRKGGREEGKKEGRVGGRKKMRDGRRKKESKGRHNLLVSVCYIPVFTSFSPRPYRRVCEGHH